jgi:hypothetical protein
MPNDRSSAETAPRWVDGPLGPVVVRAARRRPHLPFDLLATGISVVLVLAVVVAGPGFG